MDYEPSEFPVSELKTLRDADIRRLPKQVYYIPRKEYNETYNNYDIKGKSYDELVEYFTSYEALMAHPLNIGDIRLCLARAYYKGRLTGIETVLLWATRKVQRPVINIFSTSGIGAYSGLGLNPTVYETINHRILNLQFDKSCRIRYTDRYLKGDYFKPVDINVDKPYYRVQKSIINQGDLGANPEDIAKVQAKVAWLQTQNLVNHMGDIVWHEFSYIHNTLKWKETVQ